MAILARQGEQINDRDGKLIATVAADIHSGDVNFRPGQFVMADGSQNAVVSEEIMDFMRVRLSSPPPEPVAVPPPKVKGKRRANKHHRNKG